MASLTKSDTSPDISQDLKKTSSASHAVEQQEDFNIVEDRLKQFLLLERAENICCTPAEKKKLLLLIPLVIQIGLKMHMRLNYEDASAILLVVYHSLNLDQWGRPIKVLLLVGEGAMSPQYASDWMRKLRDYKRRFTRRENELVDLLLKKTGLLKKEEKAIAKYKALKNEIWTSGSPIEQAKKEIISIREEQRKFLRAYKINIKKTAESICPLKTKLSDRPTIKLANQQQEDDIKSIIQIIINITTGEGDNEKTIRRTLLGLDEFLPPYPHDDGSGRKTASPEPGIMLAGGKRRKRRKKSRRKRKYRKRRKTRRHKKRRKK